MNPSHIFLNKSVATHISIYVQLLSSEWNTTTTIENRNIYNFDVNTTKVINISDTNANFKIYVKADWGNDWGTTSIRTYFLQEERRVIGQPWWSFLMKRYIENTFIDYIDVVIIISFLERPSFCLCVLTNKTISWELLILYLLL